MKRTHIVEPLLERRLPLVEKPARYIDGECHAVRKDPGTNRIRMALAFPDVYEMGMSHLGLQLLYAVLNRQDWIAAERVYAPWPDMERYLRQDGLPLTSLETGTALGAFDLVGFSLPYELSFTNVLAMLDLGRIPLYRRDRRQEDPIVLAGGPCAFNPAPMSDFVDAFAIGEGEEIVLEIAQTVRDGKQKGWSRERLLEGLATVEGLYVPAIHTGEERIKKRLLVDLEDTLALTMPLTPLMKTIHDRITLECARGCTRGCRFCQAGMVWRPVRERSAALIEQLAEETLAATGQDELSLLSLSSGDYSQIQSLLASLSDRFAARRVALALPSLRVETLSQGLIESIRRVRKTSFTLAPEAGTQRLRNRINKGISEADLLHTVGRVFDAGWRTVKLYFMIGLPGETDADVEGIADLAYKALGGTKKRGQITVSVSTFVPKAHTPFQWERQIDLEETVAKQKTLKSLLRHRQIELRWHDHRMSLLEGLFSRGDERLGDLIAAAYNLGCRFDGWSDQFRFDLWEQAMTETSIDPLSYLRQRDPSELLPWRTIDSGLTDAFLLEEAEKARREEATPDCRHGFCSGCGVCDHQNVKPLVAPSYERAPVKIEPPGGRVSQGTIYRLQFSKLGKVRFLAHLDVSTTLMRALSRCRFPLHFSEGYHPHPRISYAYAAPVGMESLGEYADIQADRIPEPSSTVMNRLNACLPEGLSVVALEELTPQALSLPAAIEGFLFSCPLPPSWTTGEMDEAEARIASFQGASSFPLSRTVKGKQTTRDIRPYVDILRIDRGRGLLSMKLRFDSRGTVRPVDILTEVLGLDPVAVAETTVRKEETFFRGLTA